MKEIFRIEGYSVEYYADGKFIGSRTITQPDREKFGYEGRKEYVLEQDIEFGKRTLKKGTTVITQLNPIMGRTIK